MRDGGPGGDAPRVGLDDLVARAEISDVLNRYARGVDRRDAELLRSCYHPDAIDDHGIFVGPADDFVEFVTGERSRRWIITTHFLAPPTIALDGHVAAVDTYCQAHHVSPRTADGGQALMVMAVRYLDRFERRDGQWLIAHRRCAFDWSVTIDAPGATTTALPPEVVRGSRDRDDPWYSLAQWAGRDVTV
jgi:SnoaL-like domain